ncbi:unnamed protein product [Closterium sp. NIES-64]|nr:unnamed protein product [Closterium sp. NIES-64]
MDGCFDMMHYGHANALRQAKALGDELVVGVVSDEEILLNKGPPVVSLEDSFDFITPVRMVREVKWVDEVVLHNTRLHAPPLHAPSRRLHHSSLCLSPLFPIPRCRVRMVREVKWVDEVVVGTPYCITPAFMHRLFTHHRVDFIIHGDDPCLLPDGSDAYAEAKQAGRYLEVRRTEGISSTDIVGRMLLCVGSRTAATEAQQQQQSLEREFAHTGSPSRSPSEHCNRSGSPHAGSPSLPPRPSSPLPPPAMLSASAVPCSPLRPSLPPPSSSALASSAPHASSPSHAPSTEAASSPAHASAAPPLHRGSPPSSPAHLSSSPAPLPAHSPLSLAPALPSSPSCASLPSSASSGSLWGLSASPSSSAASSPLFPPSLAPLASARVSRFLPATSTVLELSSHQPRSIDPSARVVYIDGAFDVFHSGHVQTLRAAKELGTFLLVGVHSDATVRANRGQHHPIMGMHERCLSLLACRSVDEVVLDAPWVVSDQLIAAYNICLVVHGTVAESNPLCQGEEQRYAAARARGMVRQVESAAETTTTTIVTRIVDNHHAYIRRHAKKAVSEREYMEAKRARAAVAS